jgi:hypothetical protein
MRRRPNGQPNGKLECLFIGSFHGYRGRKPARRPAWHNPLFGRCPWTERRRGEKRLASPEEKGLGRNRSHLRNQLTSKHAPGRPWQAKSLKRQNLFS